MCSLVAPGVRRNLPSQIDAIKAMAAKLAWLVYRIGPSSCLLLGSISLQTKHLKGKGANLGWKFRQLKGDFLGEADAKG